MIRLPCPTHLWHDVDDLDAARIVSALTASAADGWTITDSPHRGESADDHMPCPLEVLREAGDVEMYYEHVAQALRNAEILGEDEFGEYVSLPWRDRAERRDGRAGGAR